MKLSFNRSVAMLGKVLQKAPHPTSAALIHTAIVGAVAIAGFVAVIAAL